LAEVEVVTATSATARVRGSGSAGPSINPTYVKTIAEVQRIIGPEAFAHLEQVSE
jgi:hypothetical protein